MTKIQELAIEARANKGKGPAYQARQKGLVPAIIYGGTDAPETIAVDLSTLEAAEDRDSLLRPVAAGLTGLAEIRLTPEQVSTVRHGNPVLLTGAGAPIALDECWASCAGAAVALGRVEFGQFKPSRVLAA